MPINDNIKVSVVMPVYNAYNYLSSAIESVLQQTLTEIELICVDDGSTDKSLAIIKKYQHEDSRVRIVTENNAGPSVARNKGLARARGEYVIFLDADDFYEPNLLASLCRIADEGNLDIALARYDIYNNRKGTYEDNIRVVHGEIFTPGAVVSKVTHPDEILLATTGNVWNKLFRRSFLVEKELQFLPEIRVFEDVYFVMSAVSLAERIGKVFEVLIHHRVYSGQARNRLFKKYHKQLPILYVRLKEFMMQRGVYAPLSQSFFNLSANRFHKIYGLLGKDARAHLWNELHEHLADELGWSAMEPEDVEDAEVREFVANVILYSHKVYLRRRSRGARVNMETAPRVAKNKRNIRKISGFFSRIFGKKGRAEKN